VHGANVEEHAFGGIVLIVVAIHAMVVVFVVHAIVFVDGALFEGGQVALIEP